IPPPPRSTQHGTLLPYTSLFRSDTLTPTLRWASSGYTHLIVLRTGAQTPTRSEEHTSELPSRLAISYAVFCLKKKNADDLIDHALPHVADPPRAGRVAPQ